jgi:phosphatidylserine decarboxylase
MSDNELASSADEGSDAEKAEALNAKVQRVMAPLMKKMAKQAKKIASLEDALARQIRPPARHAPAAHRAAAAGGRLVYFEPLRR